jgi:sulfur-oxidizing protein SoxY
MQFLSRRDALGYALQFTALALTRPLTESRATSADAEAEIARFTGGAPAEPGKITIDLPEIAENGNSVPLAIDVEHPMTTNDHVTDVLVVAEANPWPRVATFHFTPMSARASAATRIRLAGTQTIHVVARTNSGRLLIAQREVKVTIGGCGG